MWEATAEGETSATAAAVWALWEDPGRWRDWNRQIARAEVEGPLAVGTTARVRFRRSPIALKFVIAAFEQGRLFTDETRLPGAILGHEHVVDPLDGGAVIRNRLYLDGPLERVWSLLLGRQMRGSVDEFVELERSLAEAAG